MSTILSKLECGHVPKFSLTPDVLSEGGGGVTLAMLSTPPRTTKEYIWAPSLSTMDSAVTSTVYVPCAGDSITICDQRAYLSQRLLATEIVIGCYLSMISWEYVVALHVHFSICFFPTFLLAYASYSKQSLSARHDNPAPSPASRPPTFSMLLLLSPPVLSLPQNTEPPSGEVTCK